VNTALESVLERAKTAAAGKNLRLDGNVAAKLLGRLEPTIKGENESEKKRARETNSNLFDSCTDDVISPFLFVFFGHVFPSVIE
jgi:hypothetical protein